MIDVFGMTHVGKVRSNNEDQFLVASLGNNLTLRQTSLADTSRFADGARPDAWLLVVADGVGGVAGGELASGLAVETVGELVAQTAGCLQAMDVRREHELLESLQGVVERTNIAVHGLFGGKGQGPATTLTMVTLVWPRAYIIHVGDTRCYYLHDGRLRQITQDQTMGALMVDEGVMTEEQVARSSLGDVLSSAIGGDIDPSVGLVDLDEPDRLLVCSDGLTKHVTDDGIKEILNAHPDAEGACTSLVNAALKGGGSDNITVIVAQRETS